MFKRLNVVVVACTVGFGVLVSTQASAQHYHGHGRGHWHGGARVGVYFGLPWYAPSYYPPAYYGYPPVVYAPPAAPPVYVESGDDQAQPQTAPQTSAAEQPAPEQYWYYCPDSNAYYPYAKDCPSPWQRVPVQPPTARK